MDYVEKYSTLQEQKQEISKLRLTSRIQNVKERSAKEVYVQDKGCTHESARAVLGVTESCQSKKQKLLDLGIRDHGKTEKTCSSQAVIKRRP